MVGRIECNVKKREKCSQQEYGRILVPSIMVIIPSASTSMFSVAYQFQYPVGGDLSFC